jgi:hypothetical protein
MENLPIALEAYITHPILEAIAEVQKPRSRFVLENLIVGQEYTSEIQYKQTLTEIQALYYTIREVSLKLQITELKIAKLKAKATPTADVKAQLLELGLEQTRIVGLGALRELKDLTEIWESFPVKFTHEQIENAQPEYWNKRLTDQGTNNLPESLKILDKIIKNQTKEIMEN